jgi:DNA-binding transcriptional LysR family regulator
MDGIEVRLLRQFLVLLAERSVSRAATRLRISQPAASHALARLRKLFDDPLLIRANRGLVATARALELEPEVRRVLVDYDRLVSPVAPFDPARSVRTFVLTAPEFGELTLVPTLVRRLRAEAPNVRIEVHAPDPDRALDMLENGEVDLRIAWLTAPALSLRAMHLFEDRLVVIAHDRHPAVRSGLTLERFITLPHARTLGTSHATTIRVVDEAVSRLGRKLERSFLVQHFLTIPTTLVGTDLIATLPLTQARAFAAQHPLKVLEPPLRLPRIRYGAYWHERSHKDEGHRWLRRMIQDAARSAYPDTRGPRTREAAERSRA